MGIWALRQRRPNRSAPPESSRAAVLSKVKPAIVSEQPLRRPVTKINLNALTRILGFAAAVEVSTGLAMMIDPAIVTQLLLGAEVSGAATLLGRCFGIALLALGLACWPGKQRTARGAPAFRAMVTYNALIALFLVYLGTKGGWWGLLLWPAIALHTLIALVLVWAWRPQRD